MKKVLFIGAPGFISTHAVNEACKLGHEVAVFKRSDKLDSDLEYEVKQYKGDRNLRPDLEAAIGDFQPQVVVDFVCYRRFQAELISDLLEGRVEQYIFVSSVDYYGYPLSRLPYPEGGISETGRHTTEYAMYKGDCEEVFLKKYHKSGFPVTIARPYYSIHKRAIVNFFNGRDWNNEGGRTLVERIKFGQPVIVPGDGTTLYQAGCARNHGRMVSWMIGKTFAIGESYNCSQDSVMTIDGYVDTIAGVLGTAANIVHIPSDLLLSLGLEEVETGYIPILMRYNSYYSVEKFKKAFPDFRWEVSVEDALREYVRWNQEQELFRKEPAKTIEDRIVTAWEKSIKYMKSIV